MQSLKLRQIAVNSALRKGLAAVVVVSLVGGLSFVFRNQWLPHARAFITSSVSSSHESGDETHIVDDAHVGHDEGNSLELSPQARKNIGLTTTQVTLQLFDKTVSVPALVVERPGRSQVEVTAPLGGRVTRVYPIQGEAVMPGQPLFDLRLTHEELVDAQSELLRSAEEVDVVRREIERLDSVSIPGAIPGKTKRQREYELQKLQAIINSQRQSLELHGLTGGQVEDILTTRKLLQGVTVSAPPHIPDGHAGEADHPFHVQRLAVKPGQYVEAGSSLCVLADHHELFIEGRAFEQDIEALHRSANEGWNVSATSDTGSQERKRIDGLQIFHLADVVETESRAFHFYVRLPNQIVRDVTDEAGHRFVSWRFKPGQRMQVQVPVERWKNRFVLPVDAVVKEGADYFVFMQNGDHFDRRPVHVEYRDQFNVVVANDGSLFEGDLVALTAAHQMQMALKKKSGGGPDPHAGHNH